MQKNKKVSSRPTKNRSLAKFLFAALAVIAFLLIVLLATHIINFTKKPHYATDYSGSSYTKGEVGSQTGVQKGSSSGQTSPSATNNTPSGDQKSTGDSSLTKTLVSPTGDFVSAHSVSLNTYLSSVCNTTPGAKCQIAFISSTGYERELASETTDLNGSAFWNNWTPSSIGLTPGSWTIRGVATLGDQTQTAQDALNLTVNQ